MTYTNLPSHKAENRHHLHVTLHRLECQRQNT